MNVNDTKILVHLRKQIKEDYDDNVRFLTSGMAKSFDEYRHVCGVIRGLTQADSLINDLVHRVEHDGD